MAAKMNVWLVDGIWIDDAGTPRLLWPHRFVYKAGRTLDLANENLALFALRFIISDRPVLQVLHLYHEEELTRQQEIIGTFVPLKGVSENDT
jgi:hypothetical protein